MQRQGRVIGIVTDRDLTVRVVGQRLDPDFADVVRAQIGDGRPMAPTTLEMQAASYRRLMHEFRTESPLLSIEQAGTGAPAHGRRGEPDRAAPAEDRGGAAIGGGTCRIL